MKYTWKAMHAGAWADHNLRANGTFVAWVSRMGEHAYEVWTVAGSCPLPGSPYPTLQEAKDAAELYVTLES